IGFVLCSIGLPLAMAGMSATTSAAQSPSRTVTPLCFATSSYGAGTGPSSVGTGDFNLDGSPDLAVTNATSNDVSILLNKGDGTFKGPVNYSVGTGPQNVATGDFNLDGSPDLAITNGQSNDVSILLNNGDGTFGTAVGYPAGINPHDVVAADFNADGKLDLAIADYGPAFQPSTVTILIGRGDGTFRRIAQYDVGVNPDALAVGDFNGDGYLDFATGNNNYPWGIEVWLGNGDGTFSFLVRYDLSEGPDEMASGDFNGDGKLDMVLSVYGFSGGDATVYLGNGDGTFQPPVNYRAGLNPGGVALGDFNSDHIIDLALSNINSANLSILLGNGDGTFKLPVNFAVRSIPINPAVSDFNGDGIADVAVANNASNDVKVLTSGCPHPCTQPRPCLVSFC